MNAERPHHPEETPVSLCLHEAQVRIAVTVFKIGYQPADGEHARAVAVKALVATQHSVCAWDTGLRTLRKSVLQIQVEVFHAVATTAENGEDGPCYLAL